MNTTITTATAITTVSATATLAELIKALGDINYSEKRPTAKSLREEAGEPIAETADGAIKVYHNGYASYDNGSGVTIVFVPDCVVYIYSFDHHDDIEIKDQSEVDMTNELWSVAVTLRGESQVERNSMDRKGDRSENKGSQEEAEDKENDKIRTSHFPSPEGQYLFKEEVLTRLKRLTDKERETIIWTHTYGYTQQEIADHLGIDRTTVNHRLASAEEKFGGEKSAELLLSKVA